MVAILAKHLDLLSIAFVEFNSEDAEYLFAGFLADFGEEVFVQIGKRHQEIRLVEGLHVDARNVDVLNVDLLNAIWDNISVVVGVSYIWNDIDWWLGG